MVNLLKETEKCIELQSKTSDDISWIGSRDGEYACTWTQFKELADFEYDCGFGAQEVASDLVIVFTDNSWLSRYEYDGSEGWCFNGVPVIGDTTKQINMLTKHDAMWETLEELHKEE